MKCPKCHSDNPETSTFCADCGTRLASPEDMSLSVTKTMVSPVAKGSTVAGKYRIIEKLGEGGMGVVYKAEDTSLDRKVALKFLPPDLMKESGAKERFIREAKAAAALSHPNICTVHEIGEEEETSFIAMEYIEGESIREKIKKGPLDLLEALDIAIQAAQGLEEAHKKGIIHRDIKSANIMVTEKGQAKVMDFGIAKVSGATLITREEVTMGTVAYMSPEQAEGKVVDSRTDIWSLGVVLFEMITGQLPFSGENDQSVMYSIVHKSPEPMRKAAPKVSPELERVVGKVLEKKPADRYQNMGELLEDLRALAEGMKPLRAKTRLFRGRILGIKRVYFYAGLIVLAALIGLGLLMIIPSRGEVLDSLAVLPLVNYSGDPEQEYFADSLTDQLTADLYKVSALRVIPPQYVRQYKKTEKSPKEIARELNVKALVQGSVLRSENKVRLTAFLIDPVHDTQIWSETFEREASDIFFLQSDLSQAIVSGIKVIVTPEEKVLLASAHKVDPEAYDLYMKGYNAYKVSFNRYEALDYFNRAIIKDPDFALAYAYIGMVYWDLGINIDLSEKEAYPKAKEAILKALELNENLAFAHSNLAWIKSIMDWDFHGAEQEFLRSLELEPANIDVQHNYNIYLRIMGKFDEGIERQKRLEESLPPGYVSLLSSIYMWARRYDEGLEEAKKAYQKNPTPISKLWLAMAYGLKGMYEKELSLNKELLAIPDLSESSMWEIARIYALLGKKDEAYEAMEKIKSIYEEKGRDTSWFMAIFYTTLGDKDKAFEFLYQAYENHLGTLINIKTYPHLIDLHSDPRFQELMKKMGFDK